jgi:hypothetical protein
MRSEYGYLVSCTDISITLDYILDSIERDLIFASGFFDCAYLASVSIHALWHIGLR